MKFWFAPNTCARVTLTALEEIGAPYQAQLVSFVASEHRKPEFLAVNPAGKVPALETRQGVLVQNVAILSWLADAYPEARLLPPASDAFGRASILAELNRCSADLHPLVTRFVLPPMISTQASAAMGIREKAEEMLMFQLGPVADRLEVQPWYLGEDWSILDAYIAWIWFRLVGSGFDPDAFPAIRDHYERASARPSARAAARREARAEEELASRGQLFRPPFHKDERP